MKSVGSPLARRMGGSKPPTGKHLQEAFIKVIQKGGFAALKHIRRSDQLIPVQHPKDHDGRDSIPTHWIIRIPPPSGCTRTKTCGSITLYAGRWDQASTNGNLMINGNAAVTRCIRSTLLQHCPEVTAPPSSSAIVSHSSQVAAAPPPPPTDLPSALEQTVAYIDPRLANILLFMQPSSTPPGAQAESVQRHLMELLQARAAPFNSKAEQR